MKQLLPVRGRYLRQRRKLERRKAKKWSGGFFHASQDVLEMSHLACLVPRTNESYSSNYFVNVIIRYTCNYKKIHAGY
jgi:hypothetical protein